jgi:hypothetical protein
MIKILMSNKQYNHNTQLTKQWRGKNCLEFIKYNYSDKIRSGYCKQFGRYITNDILKSTLDNKYNIVEVYDVVHILESKCKNT